MFVAGAAPQPFGRRGVVVDLLVARRRRCPDIASFSLLARASQAPSANITVFMKWSTKKISSLLQWRPLSLNCEIEL